MIALMAYSATASRSALTAAAIRARQQDLGEFAGDQRVDQGDGSTGQQQGYHREQGVAVGGDVFEKLGVLQWPGWFRSFCITG